MTNLGPQFEQPALFDAGPRKAPGNRLDGPLLPGVTSLTRAKAKVFERPRPVTGNVYTSAHSMGSSFDSWKPNPLYDQGLSDAAYDHERANNYNDIGKGTEFIPTFRISSVQEEVNEVAINHQLEHANPLDLDDDPEVTAYPHPDTGEEWYDVRDGNHRANAAQRRGQLFMPATVRRFTQNDAAPYPKPAPASGASFNASDYF